jgi:3-methylcrotonyl-CoA carboxylase beta subunit
MARIKTALTAKSSVGEANAAEWRRLIDELNLRRRAAAEGGSTKARERHVARGKLLARERVAGLIDPDSPFLEIGGNRPYRGPRGHDHCKRPDH